MRFYECKLIQSLLMLLIAGKAALAVPDASDWREPRNFHEEFDATFGDRISIIGKGTSILSEESVLSPNGSHHLEILELTERTNNTVIMISTDKTVTILLKETYPNFPTRVRWINEKLVFIRVWWGRILGTDLIFDTDRSEFIYKEMVVDGTLLFQQTKQALRNPESNSSNLPAPWRKNQ